MKELNLKDITTEFLSCLEGYHQIIRQKHWSTTSYAKHKLTDEIDESILEYEDRIAECVMGILNTKFEIGELKTLIPRAKKLEEVISELHNDTIEFKKKIEEEIIYSGLVNILDDLIADNNKWNYLRTLQ